MEKNISILGRSDVDQLMTGHEVRIAEITEQAYITHSKGESSLPHSTFLRFPGNDTDRIIALPAFLGEGFQVAGMKWIASFPNNIKRGEERASAVLVLNSCSSGRVEAILESSIISSRRTAASAALAARALLAEETPSRVGLIGTGVINLEIARFLRALLPAARRFLLYDLDAQRATQFAADLRRELGELGEGEIEAEPAASLSELLAACPLVSFATTAIRPHVSDLAACPPGAVLLHVSLRDLAPEVILSCDNVVDDADHVCRAQTTLHLAEQATGGREFIRCSLAEILDGRAPARRGDGSIAIFHPFGLGVLDIAVGQWVAEQAKQQGRGISIPFFL